LYLFEDSLPERLQALGLREIERVVMHSNQTVMLSFHRRVLRIHRGYGFAPDDVLQAIVRFLNPHIPRTSRRLAEREFLGFPVHAFAPARPRSPDRTRPSDIRLVHRLRRRWSELNGEFFGGVLPEISIRISSRMKSRLGELSVDLKTGRPREITISRRHLARHPWSEVEHTLLHEMVHQWQAENGLAVNHGPSFRRKAREVGVLPAARRTISPAGAA
jgi:SprT-like family protein